MIRISKSSDSLNKSSHVNQLKAKYSMGNNYTQTQYTRMASPYSFVNASILLIVTSVILSMSVLPNAHARPDHKRKHQRGPSHALQSMHLLKEKLIPPHLLTQFAQEIKLTQSQKSTLKKLVKTYKMEEIDHKFKQDDAVMYLRQVIQKDQLNEKEIIQKAKVLMELEQQLKIKRLTLALKVRALLNETQLKKAYEIKEKHGPSFRRQSRRFNREFRGKHE